ncbi:hypothetical protein GCM10022257_22820 [Hyunsoonleella aestuarii]|uniref:Transmembrane protein n=1 Tax=Hyunsoonleella aestuarii TaxID=912802 RepID=A0ABP8ED69_9FLAO
MLFILKVEQLYGQAISLKNLKLEILGAQIISIINYIIVTLVKIFGQNERMYYICYHQFKKVTQIE